MKSRLMIFLALFVWMLNASALVPAEGDADTKEIKAYRLTMEKVKSFYAATRSLRKLASTDPKACSASDPSEEDEGKTLAERAKKMEAAHPKVVPLLKAEGLTTREVLVLALVHLQAGMAVYAKSMGMKELPKDVNPENVAFMEQHKSELDAMNAELKKIPDPCNRDDQDEDAEDAQ